MSKFRDEDEFNIDEDQRYAFGEDYDLDEDHDLDEDYDDENQDDDYIDYGTEAEDSERYSDYDDDWISHENRRIHGNHSEKKSDDLKG